jgi:hypothetical protein
MPQKQGIRGWLKAVFSVGDRHACTEGVCIPKNNQKWWQGNGIIVCRECGEEMA